MATVTQGAIAEAIGTFALVFVGAGSIVMGATMFGADPFDHGDLVGIALAHGLTIFVMVNAFGHISGGQFNPAVSLGLFLARKQSGKQAGVFALAQLVGAAFGALLLQLVLGATMGPALDATNIGVPGLGPVPGVGAVSQVSALVIELVLTFFLMIVIAGTIDTRSQARVGGLAIGMTVALDILLAGPITGAAMNPARWFGPALVSGYFADFWVYIVGPLAGGALGALLYARMLEKDSPAAA